MPITSLKTGIEDHTRRVFLKTSHFAEEITYTPFMKAAVTITASVFDRGQQERSFNGRIEQVHLKEVWYHVDDITSLDRRDKFTIGGTVFGFDDQAPIKTDGNLRGITVWTQQPVFAGPDNYRR